MKWRTFDGAVEVFAAWLVLFTVVYVLAQIVRWWVQ